MKYILIIVVSIVLISCANNVSTQIDKNKSFDYTHIIEDYIEKNKSFDYTYLEGYYIDEYGLIYYIQIYERFTVLSCNSYIYTLNVVDMSDDEWFTFKDNCRADVYNVRVKYDGVLYIEIECADGLIKYQATKI